MGIRTALKGRAHCDPPCLTKTPTFATAPRYAELAACKARTDHPPPRAISRSYTRPEPAICVQARRCTGMVPDWLAFERWGESELRSEGSALRRRRRSGDSGREEPSSAGWRVGVDGVSVLVDNDVVVEPAQQHEPVWVVVAAVGLVDDVVGFEAVAGGAAIALAAAIAEEHVVADALWEAVTVSGDCLQSVGSMRVVWVSPTQKISTGCWGRL